MSHFSNKLTALVEAQGTAQAFAELAGLSESSMSRLTSGRNPPNEESLEKICKLLTERDAAELIEARLRDVVPPDFRYLIKIEPVTGRTSEEPLMPDVFNRLSKDTQTALTELARLCLNDDEIADTQRRFVRIISPDWAARQDEKRS